MKHGGKRNNSGRKGKADEQKVVDKLSPLEESAHKALQNGLEAGESWAVKIFFEYMYGKPKQSTDITTNGNDININPIEWVQ